MQHMYYVYMYISSFCVCMCVYLHIDTHLHIFYDSVYVRACVVIKLPDLHKDQEGLSCNNFIFNFKKG